MSSDSLRYLRRDLPWQVLDQVGLLLQPQNRMAHELNRVAVFLWQALEEPRSLGELCALVAAEFETDGADIDADISAFIDDMVAKDLVQCLDRA
jgi:hypothetical protein